MAPGCGLPVRRRRASARLVGCLGFIGRCPAEQPQSGPVARAPLLTHEDLEAAVFENFEFSYRGCTQFVARMDWNENVTDDDWRVKLSRVQNCLRHLERLTQVPGVERPAALSGIHVPTAIVPTTAEDLPHLPPFYFVLPVWDMVVSNRVRLSGLYDPQEIDVLLRLTMPGDALVDIGANVGAVTVPMASHVGRAGLVYSFEPFRQIFQYLNANVAANGFENVHTFHTALSDEEAAPLVTVPAPSLVAGQNAGMYGVFKQNTLEPNAPTSRDKMEDVTVRTLDSFELPRANVIKIDVEGHAPRVLAGARKTLERHRPILWFEHGGTAAPEAILRPELQYWCHKLQETTEDTYLCAPQERQREVLKRMSEWGEWGDGR